MSLTADFAIKASQALISCCAICFSVSVITVLIGLGAAFASYTHECSIPIRTVVKPEKDDMKHVSFLDAVKNKTYNLSRWSRIAPCRINRFP